MAEPVLLLAALDGGEDVEAKLCRGRWGWGWRGSEFHSVCHFGWCVSGAGWDRVQGFRGLGVGLLGVWVWILVG